MICPSISNFHNLGHQTAWAEQSHLKGILDFIFLWGSSESRPRYQLPRLIGRDDSVWEHQGRALVTVHAWFRFFSSFQKKYFCWLPKSLLSKMYVICNYTGCWQMKSADFDCMSWSLNAEKTGFLKNSLLTSNNLLVTEFFIYLSDQRHHFRAKILLKVSLWKWNTNTQFFMRSETNCTPRFFIRNPNLNWI